LYHFRANAQNIATHLKPPRSFSKIFNTNYLSPELVNGAGILTRAHERHGRTTDRRQTDGSCHKAKVT